MKNIKHLILISSTLIVIALILGTSFKNAFNHINSIKVTGSAKRDFVSDVIVWNGLFGTKKMDLESAYQKLDRDKEIIIKYLKNNNVPIEDVLFSSINIKEEYDNKTDRDGIRTKEFSGYNLTQNFKIESSAVSEIENLSRDITSLIDKNIEVQSFQPYYFYSKLSDLKIDMISEATKNASIRAEKIAENSQSILGKLLNAKMGVFQITAKHSTEKYSWGGTHNKTSKNKTANVTMKLSYGVQ